MLKNKTKAWPVQLVSDTSSRPHLEGEEISEYLQIVGKAVLIDTVRSARRSILQFGTTGLPKWEIRKMTDDSKDAFETIKGEGLEILIEYYHLPIDPTTFRYLFYSTTGHYIKLDQAHAS